MLYPITQAERVEILAENFGCTIHWHRYQDENSAAADYALDATARSTGNDPIIVGDRNWWHREWLARHLGLREYVRGYVR